MVLHPIAAQGHPYRFASTQSEAAQHGTSALGSVLENVRLVERTAVVQVTDRVAGYEPFEATLSGIAEFAF